MAAPPTAPGRQPGSSSVGRSAWRITRRRWSRRATRRPSPTSQATAAPRATASTRATAAPSGGCSVRSQARTARRATASGAAASARASVGSSAAASSSSRSSSARSSCRLTGEHCGDVAPGQVVEQRQQLGAHPVAQVAGVVVGRVVDHLDAERGAQPVGLGPAQREQRPAGGRAHAGQPGRARAAQQVEQHGLGLVVERVAGEHVGRQRAVARRPRPGLQVGSVADVHAARLEPGAHRRGQPGDHVGLRRTPRPQPVVDVDGRHPAGRRRRPARAGPTSPARRTRRRSTSVPGGENVHRASRSATDEASSRERRSPVAATAPGRLRRRAGRCVPANAAARGSRRSTAASPATSSTRRRPVAHRRPRRRR